jgi:DNA polymerase-3 subunit epsilon
VQRSFDDLGTPLRDVTFCVLDLETTGGSPTACAITEVGAVKVRGGECLATFHTLVNPGQAIPPEITVLTGITQAMVAPAPRIESVLASLVEFIDGTVFVGHNVRFDAGFLSVALERAGWPRLANPLVDTCALARRLVRDEVPNCRLGTLASRLRLDHQPSHRALDDALATCDLLHVLLERAAAWGVLGLDDLLALPKLDAHPQAIKLRLTTELPRSPGVYLFRDGRGEVLYVGKATNLRQRVRSYFSGDERKKVGPLLRETVRIDHLVCAHPLEAAVTEVRLIHRLLPRYNRQAKTWSKYAYVRLTLDERHPRLVVARRATGKGLELGPLPSTAFARLVVEAIQSVVPLRRCTARSARGGPCMAAQLGVALCACMGTVDDDEYRAVVATTVAGLSVDPAALLNPLRDRMMRLAAQERFEEAADVRNRAEALASSLRRQRRFDQLRRSGTMRVTLPDGSGAELVGGVLSAAWHPDRPSQLALDTPMPAPPARDGPLPPELADELTCVAAWLDQRAGQLRLLDCDGELASPAVALASFSPAR